MSFEDELRKIDDFIEQIGVIAESDGKISKDEQDILDSIFNELSNYRALVLDVIDDGEITEEEEKEMREFREAILNKASEIAVRDGNYTDEEQSMIESIMEFAK